MSCQLTVFEYDTLTAIDSKCSHHDSLPLSVFRWLENQVLKLSASGHPTPWIRLTQKKGERALQLMNYVGVVRAPCGYQIEILPKVSLSLSYGVKEARKLLISMLQSLKTFGNLSLGQAHIDAGDLPLLDSFLQDFLLKLRLIAREGLKRGLRTQESSLPCLKGKWLVSTQIKTLSRPLPRHFECRYQSLDVNRPENRILALAFRVAKRLARSPFTDELVRELSETFDSIDVDPRCLEKEWSLVRIEPGMVHYRDALNWARLLFNFHSPATNPGPILADSFLFPMEKLFEVYLQESLNKSLKPGYHLATQVCDHSLVKHCGERFFSVKPDFVVQSSTGQPLMIADAKWKMLNASQSNQKRQYGILQADVYQMLAYGKSFYQEEGVLALIYPKIVHFEEPLPVFHYEHTLGLDLWVLPFCLASRRLIYPNHSFFSRIFHR